MSTEQELFFTIKGLIASLTAESRESVEEMAEHIRRMIKLAADGEGAIAIALIGAELQLQQNQNK